VFLKIGQYPIMNYTKNKLEKVLAKLIYPTKAEEPIDSPVLRTESKDEFSVQANINNNHPPLDFTVYLKMFIHELRTPLSTISMGTSILESDQTVNPKIIRDIKKSIGFMEEIFTKFAVIQDGNIELNDFEVFSINAMFKSVQTLLCYSIQEDNVSVECTIAPTIHDLVHGDRYNIKHCIINLLKNAIKYRNMDHKTVITMHVGKIAEVTPMPPTSERRTNTQLLMHRQISQKTAKQQTITITIRDNNDPILPHIKEHLFESFNSTSGSGLGLYICKKIVELHGGTIVHHYVQPVGNEFVITLTFQTSADTSKQNSKNISEHENSSDRSEINEIGIENESGKHKSSVLLVDDSLLNRKMMHKLLRKIHIFKHIYTASDGAQAVKKMEHADNNIRIIFLDKYMPLMGGIQTAIQLRLLGYNDLIFGLTGDANREDSDIFLKSGVDYVVIKPLDEKKLAMITNFIVTHGTCRQENRSIREINGELAWV